MTASGLLAYTGSTTVNSGTLTLSSVNQNLAGVLVLGSTVTNTAASAVTLSGANATFTGLGVYTNSTTANTITIPTGNSLNITNPLGGTAVQIGGVPTSLNQVTTNVTMTGGGAFNVTASGGTVQLGGNSITTSNYAQAVTVDLTGLSSTNINLGTSGTGTINQPTGTNTIGNQVVLKLPTPSGVTSTTPVSTITAGTLNIGNNGSFNGGTGQVNQLILGTGLTTLNVNTVNVGTGGRDMGQIIFAPAQWKRHPPRGRRRQPGRVQPGHRNRRHRNV